MAASFQRRAAGDDQIVGKMAIGALAKALSNMAGYFSGRFSKLLMEVEISDQFRPLQEWRNCIDALERLRINQQIL